MRLKLPSPVGWTALLLVLAACAAGYLWLDRPLARACAGLDASVAAVLEIVTDVGNSRWTLVPTGLLFLIGLRVRGRPRWRTVAGFLFVAVAGSGLLANLIKVVTARLRPVALLEDGAYGFTFWDFGFRHASFPSGHANTLAVLALGLGFAFPRARGWLYALAVPLALTRVVLDYHYLSDVIAGAYLAVVTTLVWERWLARRGWPVRPQSGAVPGGGASGGDDPGSGPVSTIAPRR